MVGCQRHNQPVHCYMCSLASVATVSASSFAKGERNHSVISPSFAEILIDASMDTNAAVIVDLGSDSLDHISTVTPCAFFAVALTKCAINAPPHCAVLCALVDVVRSCCWFCQYFLPLTNASFMCVLTLTNPFQCH